MASRKQISDTIQAVANAATVNGFAQALEDIVKGCDKQVEILQHGDKDDPWPTASNEKLARVNELLEMRGHVSAELDRRKTELASLEAVSRSAVTVLLSRPLPRLRLTIAKFLGGAAQRLARP